MTYSAYLRGFVGHNELLIPSVAACIKDNRGRILIVRRGEEQDLWGFPGGGIELGEGATEALAREVREEIGLEIEPMALIGIYSSPHFAFNYPNKDRVQPLTLFFDCRVVAGECRPDDKEVTAVRYLGPNDRLPPMHPCCRAKAWDAFADQGKVFFR